MGTDTSDGARFESQTGQDLVFLRPRQPLLGAKLPGRLAAAGLSPWYDQRLTPGSRWSAEIERNIARCAAFVVVVSRRSAMASACGSNGSWTSPSGSASPFCATARIDGLVAAGRLPGGPVEQEPDAGASLRRSTSVTSSARPAKRRGTETMPAELAVITAQKLNAEFWRKRTGARPRSSPVRRVGGPSSPPRRSTGYRTT